MNSDDLMSLRKIESEKFYDESRYHINKVLFILNHDTHISWQFISLCGSSYITIISTMFYKSQNVFKEKAFYFRAFHDTLFPAFFEEGVLYFYFALDHANYVASLGYNIV